MIIVIFLTMTLFGYFIYINKQVNTHIIPLRKMNMGYFPKTSNYQYLSVSDPTQYSSYLQMTNNRKTLHKCDARQPNIELCSELPSDRIETNIQYSQEPYILY
jgi:hypothetical protein